MASYQTVSVSNGFRAREIVKPWFSLEALDTFPIYVQDDIVQAFHLR